MSLHVKASGAWKNCTAAYVKVSGAWKQCNGVYVKASGAWKKVFPAEETVTTSGVEIGGTTVNKYKVTLSNVKSGSTIKITGTWRSRLHQDEPENYFCIGSTGATAITTPDRKHKMTWFDYDPEEDAQFCIPGDNKSRSFTIEYKATKTTVTFVMCRTGGDAQCSVTNCKITYTKTG